MEEKRERERERGREAALDLLRCVAFTAEGDFETEEALEALEGKAMIVTRQRWHWESHA